MPKSTSVRNHFEVYWKSELGTLNLNLEQQVEVSDQLSQICNKKGRFHPCEKNEPK
jgi:hypothetical protein